MVLIAVHGSAIRSLPAERGTLRLTMLVEHEDRATALHAVVALHERCAADAGGFVRSGAATWWSSGQVTARAEHRWSEAERGDRVVQVASASVQVRFRDFAALSAWVDTIGADPDVVVEGVDWSLTAATRDAVLREIRVQAVRDATARAEAYADAVGATAVVLQSLWEAGLRPGTAGGGPVERGMVRAASVTDAPRLALHPAAIEVAAAITADFLIDPPS